jgi:ABC-type transport system involved in multi-copper enzyme maturation permease subunit
VGNQEKADWFAAIPPMVVFFAWAAFKLTPGLVLFTSAETIAAEVASRSIRYSVLRTGRLSFALGKMAGQALILAGVTALQAAAFYGVAWMTLDGFEAGANAAGLLSYWPRIFFYLLPFLSWSMFASMVTASTNLARLVSIGGGLVLAILAGLASSTSMRKGPVTDALWDLASYLTPFGHQEGLFYPPGGRLGGDVAVCLSLTVLYFAMGFAVLRRRDL